MTLLKPALKPLPLRYSVAFGFLLLISIGTTYSQETPEFAWAIGIGANGPTEDEGRSIAIDGFGNIYVTGSFSGTVDFDPGTATYDLTSQGDADIFILKLDPDKNFLWAKSIGGTDEDIGRSILVDAGSQIVVTGSFNGTVDFDPLNGANLTSLAGSDVFVLKMDPDGNYIWAVNMGSDSAGDAAVSYSITADDLQNLYLVGDFTGGPADFDPSPLSSYTLTSNSNSHDIFIAKLDLDGNFLWANQVGGSASDKGYSIAVDLNQQVYFTGSYEGTVDFDSGPATSDLTGGGAFVSKLDIDGNFLWAVPFSSTGATGLSLTTDASGNVYTTGSIFNTTDFDPGAATVNLTPGSAASLFVSKLDTDGNFVFALQSQGTGETGSYGIKLDNDDNIYITGTYSGDTDFDPGPSTFDLTGIASFICKLDVDGNFIWAQTVGTADVFSWALAVDFSKNVFTTGIFFNTADFDPGTGIVNLTSEGGGDIFIQKTTRDLNGTISIDIQPSSGPVCMDDEMTLETLASGAAGISYRWQRFNGSVWNDMSDQDWDTDEGWEGTDTRFLTIHLTSTSAGSSDFRCRISSTEAPDEFTNAATVTVTSAPPIPVVSAVSGCGNGNYLITATGGSSPHYRWFDEDETLISDEVDGNFLTPVIGQPTEYFVAINNGACNSALINVVVNPATCSVRPGLVSNQLIGGSSITRIKSMDTDPANNVYMAGTFTSTIDFDPGAGVFNMTPIASFSDAFISKHDDNGNFMWAKQLENVSVISVDADNSGNLYITGSFQNTIDFDPGTPVVTLTSAGGFDIFILKLNTNGDYQWAHRIGGSSTDHSRALATDATGNVYMTGSFSGVNVDFNPAPGTGPNVVNLTSGGNTDAFILKLDANGSFVFVRRIGGPSLEAGFSIAVDASDNIYTTGRYAGTATDFDPDGGIVNVPAAGTAIEVYIHKLNASGNFVWAKGIGSASVEVSNAIALDGAANVYTIGTFQGTADFDPGAGTFTISAGGEDMFVSKLTTAGDFVWAKALVATQACDARDLAVDVTGNVFLTGFFEGGLDADPSAATYNLYSSIQHDVFVSQLDPAGNFVWAYSMNSSGRSFENNEGQAIVLDGNGNIYAGGELRASADLDPGDCPLTVSPGGISDAFIHKINPSVKSICINLQSVDASVCDDVNVDLSINATGTTNITYQWTKYDLGTSLFQPIADGGGYSGTASPTLSINTAGNFGNGFYRCEVNGDLATTQFSNSSTIVVTAIPSPPTVTGATGCAPDAYALTASGSTDGNYQWYTDDDPGATLAGEVNGTYTTPVISETTTYYVSIKNGSCESTRTSVNTDIISSLIPPAATGAVACTTPASVTLTASGAINGQYRWYTLASGGTHIAGEVNDTYITPALSADTDFYVSINDGTCESVRTLVTASVASALASPGATGASHCGSGAVTLNASGGTDGDYRWYAVAIGGTAISGETNGAYTTPVISTTTTYYVALSNGTCESARIPADAQINPVPSAPVISSSVPLTSGSVFICIAESVDLTAPAGFMVYTWSTGASTQVITTTLSGEYTLTVTNASGCVSPVSAAVTVMQTGPCNQAPFIAATTAETHVEGTVTINLSGLISDEDNNIDLTTLRIVTPPISGATATINSNNELVIDYHGVSFAGTDRIVIEVCDLSGACTQQELLIEVSGDVTVFNAVSPNGDHLNDELIIEYINGLPNTRSNHVTIYNRWGDVVFDIADYNNDSRAFRGVSNSGNELPSGTYFYKISFTGNPNSKTGYLYLKR